MSTSQEDLSAAATPAAATACVTAAAAWAAAADIACLSSISTASAAASFFALLEVLDSRPLLSADRDLGLSLTGSGSAIWGYFPPLPKLENFAARSANAGSDVNCAKQCDVASPTPCNANPPLLGSTVIPAPATSIALHAFPVLFPASISLSLAFSMATPRRIAGAIDTGGRYLYGALLASSSACQSLLTIADPPSSSAATPACAPPSIATMSCPQ